ncbi:hypothetical protein [Sulfurimonas sp.]
MKSFTSPEANLLFSSAIVLEKIVLKAQKNFDKKQLSPENFIELRENLLNITKTTNELIEEISKNSLGKKSFYQKTEKRKKYA